MTTITRVQAKVRFIPVGDPFNYIISFTPLSLLQEDYIFPASTFFTLGASNPSMDVFSSVQEAIDFYYPAYGQNVIDQLNALDPDGDYVLGDVVYLPKEEQEAIDSEREFTETKQDHSETLDDFADLTIADHILDMLETSNKSETRAHLEIDTAALYPEEHFATPAYVDGQINALINSAPGTLDTLGEIAAQLAVDESAVGALTAVVNGKADKTITVNGQALSANVVLSKADVGLGNADNTSDANKPVSTAAQTALNGKFNTPVGTTAQYLRGDGSLASFPSIPSAQVNADWNASSGVAQILNKPTSFPPFAHTHAASDIVSGTFSDARIAQSNVTQHQAALSIASSQVTGTKTSAYISDFVEAAQDAVGAALSAEFVYSDAANTIGLRARSFNYVTPTLNAAAQLSATRDVLVSYVIDISASLTLTGGATGTVVLEIADDAAITTNVQTVCSAANGNTGTLTIGLALTQTATATLSGVIPAGKYRRLRTVNTVGTPTFTARPSQEVLL